MAALAVAFMLPEAAADAQGVFDMGQLTGTLSQDAVTKSERARARPRPSKAPSGGAEQARAVTNCRVMLPRFQKRYGARDPQVMKLAAQCRALLARN